MSNATALGLSCHILLVFQSSIVAEEQLDKGTAVERQHQALRLYGCNRTNIVEEDEELLHVLVKDYFVVRAIFADSFIAIQVRDNIEKKASPVVLWSSGQHKILYGMQLLYLHLGSASKHGNIVECGVEHPLQQEQVVSVLLAVWIREQGLKEHANTLSECVLLRIGFGDLSHSLSLSMNLKSVNNDKIVQRWKEVRT